MRWFRKAPGDGTSKKADSPISSGASSSALSDTSVTETVTDVQNFVALLEEKNAPIQLISAIKKLTDLSTISSDDKVGVATMKFVENNQSMHKENKEICDAILYPIYCKVFLQSIGNIETKKLFELADKINATYTKSTGNDALYKQVQQACNQLVNVEQKLNKLTEHPQNKLR